MASKEPGRIRKGLGQRRKKINELIKESSPLISMKLPERCDELEDILSRLVMQKDSLENKIDLYTECIAKLGEVILKDDTQYDKEVEESDQMEQVVEDLITKVTLVEKKMDRLMNIESAKLELKSETDKFKLEEERLEVISEKNSLERLKLEEAKKTQSAPNPISQAAVKLPKLDFEKFDGTIIKWQSFWNSFKAAVHDRSISDVDKMNYLKSKLEGEAKCAIQGYPLSGSNYQLVLDVLRERYGRSDLIIAAHFSMLSSLPQASNNTVSLRKTYDQLEMHIRSLEVLAEPVESHAIVTTIMSKLPKTVIKHIMDKKPKDEPWTVQVLHNF